jgi:hypothetical protein
MSKLYANGNRLEKSVKNCRSARVAVVYLAWLINDREDWFPQLVTM